jgi:hypothetical protein
MSALNTAARLSDCNLPDVREAAQLTIFNDRGRVNIWDTPFAAIDEKLARGGLRRLRCNALENKE